MRQYIDDMLTYLAENDEYIGWSIWAAGPIWGTASPCCGPDTGSLEPGNVDDLGLPNAFYSLWPASVRPNIPTGECLGPWLGMPEGLTHPGQT